MRGPGHPWSPRHGEQHRCYGRVSLHSFTRLARSLSVGSIHVSTLVPLHPAHFMSVGSPLGAHLVLACKDFSPIQSHSTHGTVTTPNHAATKNGYIPLHRCFYSMSYKSAVLMFVNETCERAGSLAALAIGTSSSTSREGQWSGALPAHTSVHAIPANEQHAIYTMLRPALIRDKYHF